MSRLDVRGWFDRFRQGGLLGSGPAHIPTTRRPFDRPFGGEWADRHPLNVPGRYYTGCTDTMGLGPVAAPDSVLVDHEWNEFVWRQPRDEVERQRLLRAAEEEPTYGTRATATTVGHRNWSSSGGTRDTRRNRSSIDSSPVSGTRHVLRRTRKKDSPTGMEADLLRYAARLKGHEGRAPSER